MTSEIMLNLRKQIDFGLLGEEGDHPLVNKMELDDYLSEETSPSPPAVKVARIPVSRVYQRRRSVDDTNQNSPPCTPGSNGAPRTHTRLPSSGGGGGSFQYFTTPSPTQPQARVTSASLQLSGGDIYYTCSLQIEIVQVSPNNFIIYTHT